MVLFISGFFWGISCRKYLKIFSDLDNQLNIYNQNINNFFSNIHLLIIWLNNNKEYYNKIKNNIKKNYKYKNNKYHIMNVK